MEYDELKRKKKESLYELFKKIYTKASSNWGANIVLHNGTQKDIGEKVFKIKDSTTTRLLNPKWLNPKETDLGPKSQAYAKALSKAESSLGIKIYEDGSTLAFRQVSSDGTPPLSIEGVMHFLYYFCPPTAKDRLPSVQKAHVMIFPDRVVHLSFYEPEDLITASLESLPAKYYKQYTGKLLNKGNMCCIEYNKRNTQEEKNVDHFGFSYLDENIVNIKSWKNIICFFTSKGPVAGVAFLRKEEPGKLVNSLLMPPPIGIEPMLRDKMFGSNHFSEARKAYSELFKTGKRWEGNYVGICFAEKKDHGTISVEKFKIYDGYKITYESREAGHEVHGYLTYYSGGNLQARLSYLSTYNQYEVHLSFRLDSAAMNRNYGDAEVITGIFALSRKTQTPSCGRIILIKADQSVKFKDMRVELIRPSQESSRRELFQNYPFLEKFLFGKLDNYIYHPRPKHVRSRDNTRKATTKKTHELARIYQGGETEIFNPEFAEHQGLYATFRLSSRKDRVYQRPVRIIGMTGEVQRYTRRTEDNQLRLFLGEIRVLDSSLEMALYEEFHVNEEGDWEDYYEISRTSLIHLSNQTDDHFDIRPAHTLGTANTGVPTSYVEFYCRLPEKEAESIDDTSQIYTWSGGDNVPQDEPYRSLVQKMLDSPDEYVRGLLHMIG